MPEGWESETMAKLIPDTDMRIWRHEFHRHPELGFDVGWTAARVAELLGGFGCEVHTGMGGTGVVGVLRRGESDNAIALRADMDALPIQETEHDGPRSQIDGVFHGCGHDGHMAMLLGAAQHLANNDSFDGTVVFIFQPDEENGRGAPAMIADGLFERFPVAAIFGLHNKPEHAAGHFATRVGPMMASEDLFEITIQGRGGHASMPHRLIDPVVVAAQIISGLQTIISRSVPAVDAAVVSVTEVITDGARNIVPSTVTIKGDCRTFTPAAQDTIESRMRQIVEATCAAYGASGTVWYNNEFIPLVNHAAEVEASVAAAQRVVGEPAVDGSCDLILASEDFAHFTQVVPGAFIDLGTGRDGTSLHSPTFRFNDDVLATGAGYWVELVRMQLAAG
ncbi:MAG: amidohydrolase [bacterium]|nr:amidohydrolase [bacterium]